MWMSYQLWPVYFCMYKHCLLSACVSLQHIGPLCQPKQKYQRIATTGTHASTYQIALQPIIAF